MMNNEVIELINYMRTLTGIDDKKKRADKMRKKIISMAHECGWHTLINGKWIIDMNRLNAWMLKSSYLHKRLDEYNYKELPLLVTQFEQVYKSFLNKV